MFFAADIFRRDSESDILRKFPRKCLRESTFLVSLFKEAGTLRKCLRESTFLVSLFKEAGTLRIGGIGGVRVVGRRLLRRVAGFPGSSRRTISRRSPRGVPRSRSLAVTVVRLAVTVVRFAVTVVTAATAATAILLALLALANQLGYLKKHNKRDDPKLGHK
jgi:hypothetical protein